MYPYRSICLAILSFSVTAASLAGTNSRISRKHLPIDKLPGVVMKTPENSHFLPDRIIVKLTSTYRSSSREGFFGVSSLDDIAKRISARPVERMFPHHKAPFRTLKGKATSVDLTRF